jgi:holo-[acyl-carrier protein] synthase
MGIIGHGIDIVEVSRVRALLDRHGERFLRRVFCDGETAYCMDHAEPAARLAGRFAVKEAVLKAIGTGWRDGIAWTDVEVRNLASGAPTLELRGKALEVSRSLGIRRWVISISHTRELATASVIGEGEW